MGYTHYWTHNEPFTDEEWNAIKADAAKVLEVCTVPLWHEYDEPDTKPTIDDEAIFFNGTGDDGHETFVLEKNGNGFNFCKTAAKPYDRVVVAMLILAHKHAPDAMNISSDGGAEDWEDGAGLVAQACGEGYSTPFTAEETTP